MSDKKLVVFDLDGTLNKTHLYAVPAHKKALAEYGVFDKTDEVIIETFGARAQDSVPTLLGECSEDTISEYLHKASSYETEFITDYAGEFDGITQMLTSLKSKGYLTAVCSNASERYINMVLDALNLQEKIDYIQPLLPNMTKDDTLNLLLKKVKPTDACMVGDRIYDKLAAHHNQIPFIGCLYGYEKSEVADADIAVNAPIDIVDAVIKLIP